MMVLAAILAFTSGVCVKVYTSTGDISYIVVAVVLAVACLLATLGWVVRERGLL